MMNDHAAEKNKDKNVIEKKPLTPMPPPPKLERTSSIIITEPRTLTMEELNAAREGALKIINTHTKEEALKIFMTGSSVPKSNVKQVEVVVEDIAAESDWEEDDDDYEE